MARQLRFICYSYLDLKLLATHIRLISKSEGKDICDPQLLDQERPYKVVFSKDHSFNKLALEYLLQLCTSIVIEIQSFQEADIQILSMILTQHSTKIVSKILMTFEGGNINQDTFVKCLENLDQDS